MLTMRYCQLKWIQRSLLVLLALACLGPRSAKAQQPWSAPAVIYDSQGLQVGDYEMLADAAGDLHLFISVGGNLPERSSDHPPNFVIYMRKSGEEWSPPNDIVLNSDPARFNRGGGLSAAVDSKGGLHLVMSIAPLQYWHSTVNEAHRAWGWESPQNGPWNVIGVDAKVFVGTDDTVHLVYSDTSAEVYHTLSDDGGVTWRDSVRISEVQPNLSFVDGVDAALDEQGRIHIVWNEAEAPSGYPPTGVFYARSDDGGLTWRAPVQLGERYGNKPAIAIVGDRIHVIWSTSLADKGRYFSDSLDGGESWAPATVLTQGMGAVVEFERDRLTVDSSDRVYWIISDESPGRGTVDRFTLTAGQGWETPRSLELPLYENDDAWLMRGAVVQVRLGNQFDMVVLNNQPEAGLSRLLYYSRLLDSPATAPAVFLAPAPTAAPTTPAVPQVELAPADNIARSPTVMLPDTVSRQPVRIALPSSASIVLSVLAASILTGVVFAFRIVRSRR